MKKIERNTLNYYILFELETNKKIFEAKLSKEKDFIERHIYRSKIEHKQMLIDEFKAREGIPKEIDYLTLLEILSD